MLFVKIINPRIRPKRFKPFHDKIGIACKKRWKRKAAFDKETVNS